MALWKMRKAPRVYAALLLVAALAAVALLLGAQENWTKRDAWQRPAEVMDALSITPGSVVADVGAGNGYFTFRLAERVGATGKVYAVDVDNDPLEKIRKRAKKQGLTQIEALHSAPKDPRLPADVLDAVLVVNAYHEMREYDAMMRAMYQALKPGGLLGIIDDPAQQGKARGDYQDRHKIPAELVREDASRNGFRFLHEAPGFVNNDNEHWFFLIFEKPNVEEASEP